MAAERRKGERISFERGIAVHIVALDGTWQRDCQLEDVSESGAKLSIAETSDKIDMKEFFLLLSSTGLAYRRCELAWQNGGQIGVNFIRPDERRKKPRRSPATAEA